jgi:hypothetical protein
MKFGTGDRVYKHGAGYSGPGEVVTGFLGGDGHPRYVVGHRISDGRGEFFHIYSEAQLSAYGPTVTYQMQNRIDELERELTELRALQTEGQRP